MKPKYEFTGETMHYEGFILHRIRRLSDEKLGGWIEKESNLSQEDSCWVDDNAKVFDNAVVRRNALVYENAKVYDDACVTDNAKVYGDVDIHSDAQVYNNAIVCGNACVNGDAKIGGNAQVFDDAYVYGRAQVGGHAMIYNNAEVYGKAYVHGDAEVYGHAKVYDDAEVYGNARVYGIAQICNNARVYDNAKVCWGACIKGNAKIYGNATVIDAETCEYWDEYLQNKDSLKEIVQDFIYKVDDSNKLTIGTSYDSIDDFFEDDSVDSYRSHEAIVVLTVDTKMPIIVLEKAEIKDKKVFRFIVDITNEDGDTFNIKSTIDSKEKFNQLLQSTLDALKQYPQFSKYAEELENIK